MSEEKAMEELYKPIDATIKASVASDRMSAGVVITKPENGGKEITKQDILDALASVNVVYGLDEELINELAKLPIYNKLKDVAHGTKPINGEDGYVEYFVQTKHTNAATDRGDGTVDWRKLDIITVVHKADLLCRLHEPKEGVEGMDVLGNSLPYKPGKPAILPHGKNVVSNEAKTECYAGINGKLTSFGNSLSVEPCYHVTGDVDLKVGNIDFTNDVIITGSVREGFIVKSGGNITVNGSVENATLIADGDIKVLGGVYGNGRNRIKAKGNIECKFIEYSNVTCGGDLTCNYITNSNIICDSTVNLVGDQGSLVGGRSLILRGLRCKDIGSESETVKTFVELGSFGELLNEKERYEKEYAKILFNEPKLAQIVDYLNGRDNLTKTQKELLEKSKTAYDKMLADKANLQQNIMKIENRVHFEGTLKVEVKGTIYRGLTLKIIEAEFVPENSLSFVRLSYDKEQKAIIQSPLM